MFSKTKAKPFALGLALVLALAVAPQALAGPALGGDLGDVVYGFFAEIWQSVSSMASTQDEAQFGPWVGPNGEPSATGDDQVGAGLVPNGMSSQAADEYGPLVIPDGETSEAPSADDEYGAYIIPNG